MSKTDSNGKKTDERRIVTDGGRAVYELDHCIDTIQTKTAGTVHIETGGIDHRETDVPIQVEAEHSHSGTVHVSVGKAMPAETTEASATCYLSPDEAEQLADALRANSQTRLFTDDANVWVEKGWLYTEGVADDGETNGEVEYVNGSLSVVTTVDGSLSGAVLGAVSLTEPERHWLAATLETEAETAREQEPVSEPSPDTTTGSRTARWKRGVKLATSLGIPLGVTGLVTHQMMSELAGESITFTEPEPGTLAVPLVLIGFCALLVAAATGGIPGVAGIGKAGGRL